MEWLRFRFETTDPDYRPIKVPAPGPWWCSGHGVCGDNDTNILIADAHSREEILDYWPDTIDFSDESPEDPTFSSRFPKPDGWDEAEQRWEDGYEG